MRSKARKLGSTWTQAERRWKAVLHVRNATLKRYKKKSFYMNPGQPAKSTAKPNIHGTKEMLCIWWEQVILYYELLKPGETINAERPHWNTVHIRTGYQKLAWFILGRQAGAVLLGWNPQIARKMGKSHSVRWAILWIILLYMYFLNKRSNVEKTRTN